MMIINIMDNGVIVQIYCLFDVIKFIITLDGKLQADPHHALELLLRTGQNITQPTCLKCNGIRRSQPSLLKIRTHSRDGTAETKRIVHWANRRTQRLALRLQKHSAEAGDKE